MLEINKIVKVYETAGFTQKALDGVSIKFRESEFVSILGPSGSGKTTLLNIIGGLDQYTSGDLVIDGISTKKYKSKDWDTYRNNRVGFVFQSYNLISHQSILSNVELALTLAGVSKKERRIKAKKALKEVGLEKHIHKKPNQLSGGQMQRVAIARALINDPSIILADEPTGALDTTTSKQIMDLLSKISKNKLVIMVTHNPSLAEEYSSRIIKLQDGKIIDDSDPYKEHSKKNISKTKKTKKTSMSFLTALGLSFNNLLTKKGRTILTAFAGSIGIIGIALILSLSNGFQKYIDDLQEDTLSSYPLTISSETMDFSSFLVNMMEESNVEGKEGKIVENQEFIDMFSNIKTNDMKSLKKYLESKEDELSKITSSIDYAYSIEPTIYTKSDKEIIQVNPNTMFSSMFSDSSMMSSASQTTSIFSKLSEDKQSVEDSYKLLKGRYPTNYDEVMLVLPDDKSISDLFLYLLGIRDMDELYKIMNKVMAGEEVNINNEPMEFTYDDFLNLDLRLIEKVDLYKYNKKYKIYEDMSDDKKYVKKLFNDALKLKVVGVSCPKDTSNMMGTSVGIKYNSSLIDYIITNAGNSTIVKKQLKNKDIDVFSNKDFDSASKSSKLDFNDLISVDTKMLQSAFNMDISESDISDMTKGYMDEISSSITTDITPAKNELTKVFNDIAINSFKNYIENPYETKISPIDNTEKSVISLNDSSKYINEYLDSSYVDKKLNSLKAYLIPNDAYKKVLTSLLGGLYQSYIVSYSAIDPSYTTDTNNPYAVISNEMINNTVDEFMKQAVIITSIETLSKNMTEAKMKSDVLTKVGELTSKLMNKIASSFNVDTKKISSAFNFQLNESELTRLMDALTNKTKKTDKTNLIELGYQDIDDPSYISFYFQSFDNKESFLDFIDNYNKDVDEDKKINYTDTTGILMSSVKKIVDSVSYVLVAFVSIALVVSSIMIGIITYISVLERTKEIGILRAIGASKRNISSIFNAETFIIGLLSGLIGIGFTLSVIPLINKIIHTLTNNYNINASIPIVASIILIVLSVVLTLIGGFIPSRIASKKDPVEALRTE